jgi:hypothetical protein
MLVICDQAWLNKNNFNGDRGFILSQAWSPITNMLMNVKPGPSRQVLDSIYNPRLATSYNRHIYHERDGLQR